MFPLAYVVDGVGVGVCDGGSVGGGGGGSVGGSVGGGVLGQSSGKKFWPVDRNPRCARPLLPLKRVVGVVRGVCKASVAERGGTADHAAVPPAAHGQRAAAGAPHAVVHRLRARRAAPRRCTVRGGAPALSRLL